VMIVTHIGRLVHYWNGCQAIGPNALEFLLKTDQFDMSSPEHHMCSRCLTIIYCGIGTD